MKLSARNQLQGKVLDIEKNGILAKVKIQIEPTIVTSVITKDAVEELGIQKDDKVVGIIKATEVMVGKE